LKIYFAASISGGRKYLETYKKMVSHLQKLGHWIPTEHIAHPEVLTLEKALSPKEIYQRDIEWIKECDALVAEVSNPSLGVGYEICFALNLGKPVLCLYEKGIFLSRMILGNTSPGLKLGEYVGDSEWESMIDSFLSRLKKS